MSKKKVRESFRTAVYKRDKNTCQVCGKKHTDIEDLDAHHITDRSEMPNGGYVKENGISLCKDVCHMKCEKFHISGGLEWEEGMHPDDLYKKINSSKELAIKKSNELEV
jgi:5-methylcytosine-specific restriction endonuclease McrA